LLPRRFGLVGYFQLPQLPADLGPSDLGVQWAVTIGVRDSENLDVAKQVGATHQVRNLTSDPPPPGVKILLGVGTGVVPNSTMPGPDLTSLYDAYGSMSNRIFTLETLIDADAGTGTSWLRITGGKTWQPRSWQFAFQMTAVTFGLAMVNGGG